MDLKTDAIVGAVGDTYAPNRAELRSPRPSQLRHFVLNFHEIATGRFRDLEVGAGTLTVLSTFPVIVRVDGDPIVGDEDLPPISNAGLVSGWNPSLDPAFVAGTILRPGASFTLRRRIQRLTIEVSGNTADYTGFDLPGQCHIWVGPSDVESMDFGLPVSHILDNNGAATAIGAASGSVLIVLGDTLHRGAASPTSGLRWVPSRTELWGALLEWTWTGAAGVLSAVQINMVTNGGSFILARYAPGVNTPWDYDFGSTLEVPGYQAQNLNAPSSLIEVAFTATQSIANMIVCLRARSWM